MSIAKRGKHFVIQVPGNQSLQFVQSINNSSLANIQNSQNWCGVTEFVFIFLDSDIIRAIVNVNSSVLGAQPHSCL